MTRKIATVVLLVLVGLTGVIAQPQRNAGFFSSLTLGAVSASSLATISAARGGSATYDPPSSAAGAAFATTMSITGVTTTNVCVAGHSSIGSGNSYNITATAGTDVINAVFINQTGGVSDLASGTLRVLCFAF